MRLSYVFFRRFGRLLFDAQRQRGESVSGPSYHAEKEIDFRIFMFTALVRIFSSFFQNTVLLFSSCFSNGKFYFLDFGMNVAN